ncbi:Major facilitator superfamily protein [Perilla frutescens var. hirtella]|uniref:Major facilitator superfamily protein n=1 Tax=Perilla frutescens var. hirtella TaxID=608512 RepID=A0AAD4JHP0_PERFH|nr:Major facilitator superfamily protein [Perilla frutescens var. hirtella]
MAITTVTGDGISEAGIPLLEDVVTGSVSFNGRPSRRSKSGCWKSASFIIGVEVAERFAYNGICSNLITYLTGPLGQSTAAAAANVNVWDGTATLLTLLGAFVADSFWGRYRTIIIASVTYILGLGFLSVSAAFHSSNSSSCKNNDNSNCSPPAFEVVFFFFSLYLVAFGQGGHKPCVQAFGADQFDEEDEAELKAKSSFFNWWYFSMNGGILAAILVLNYVQEYISWELGFGIPCIVMCLALVVFLLGSMTYRFHISSDERNPFVRIGRVFVKAARNWKATPAAASMEEKGQGIPSQRGAKLTFLDKAILVREGADEDGDTCSIVDINEAKGVLGLVPIWCTCLGYAIISSQASTLFTKQGATMDRHITRGFQIPAASLQSLISTSILVLIPIYDCFLIPVARIITKKPAGISMLQRIGAGIFLSFLVMVIAALVERQRLATAVGHGLVDKPDETVPMSVWWLAPQYLLLGFADVFTMVGLQEFFYDQVPAELKSLGLALYLSIFGIGSFLSSFLISFIDTATSGDGHYSWFSSNLNRARLDYFYWLLGCISAVTMAAYVYSAKSYTYKRKE